MRAFVFLLSYLTWAGFGAHANGIEPKANVSLWGAGSYRDLVTSPTNPDNQVAQIAGETALLEARPEVGASLNVLTLALRPRLRITGSQVTAAGVTNTDTATETSWSEAFLSLSAHEQISMTYGLQSYQWGPAEAGSPSNRIFRETVRAQDVLYELKGHHLLRANFTPTQNWSEVALFEITDNGQAELEAEERFARKALLKSELSWGGGANYAGVVLGARERRGAWVGEYGSVEIVDGLSAYIDTSHEQGSLAWYPIVESSGAPTVLSQSKRDDAHINTFAVTGVRYAFESGSDLRAEWVFQEAGYTTDEVTRAWDAMTSSDPPQAVLAPLNAARWARNGLEFPGRHYALLSYRLPDAFNTKDWTLYFRALLSMQDWSSASYISSENAIGTNGTLFGSLSATAGRVDSELRGLVGTAITLGYRYAW